MSHLLAMLQPIAVPAPALLPALPVSPPASVPASVPPVRRPVRRPARPVEQRPASARPKATPAAATDPAADGSDGRAILAGLLAGLDAGGDAGSSAALADALLAEFGSLARLLSAGPAAQRRVIGDRPAVLRCLALVRGAMLNVLAADLADTPLLNDGAAVTDYLHVAMAHEPREQVRALFLDASLRLIRDEVLGTGSITAAPVYPREIMRRALELGATGLILAHNHPSGNREPSRSDIQITRQLADAGRALDIKLHDHLIITRTGHTSLRELGHV